jgi:hypothetical protein
VLEEQRDKNNNILSLLARIKGEPIILICIYGPNKLCDDFFVDLERILSKYKNIPAIIGGDWNLTPSPLPVSTNPDTLNMLKIPNEKHTRILQSLQLKFSLVDAFRVLYPNRREFLYSPRDCTKNNRSRIDFFFISRALIPLLQECSISPVVQSKLFDHKAVTMSFKKKVTKKAISNITPATTKHILTPLIVECVFLECHLHHWDAPSGEGSVFKENSLTCIGRARKLIFNLAKSSGSEDDIEWATVIGDIKTSLQDLQSLDIDLLPLNIDDDLFLDYLVNCIVNDVLSFQRFLTKNNAESKKILLNKIANLKLNINSDFLELKKAEAELTELQDAEMRAEIEKFRHYDVIHNEK